MLIETPWPKEGTITMLKRLGHGFGRLLETHIPSPDTMTGDQDFFTEKSTES